MPVSSATLNAPAKINLTLDVLGQREDGFHDLRSLALEVDLCDRVTCHLLPKPGILLACEDASLRGSGNLAVQAALKLAERCGRKPALEIGLEKRIPVGAGLGGGSSDAAATVRLCNQLWGNGLGPVELASIGSAVGSDVPLFFFLPSAVITGRGEQVTPVTLRWSGWALLVFAQTFVSTREVYRAWRPRDTAGLPSGMEGPVAEATHAAELMAMLSNHLEPAVFRVAPKVAKLHAELDRSGFGPFRVSGAGSTLYRLFDTKEAACRAASEIRDRWSEPATVVVAAPVGQGRIAGEEC